MMPWRAFLARTTVAAGLLGMAMFVALRLAAASPGGPTRHELTYAGVLRNADGGVPVAARMTALTFTFSKTGAAPCVVEVPRVEVAAGGAFTAPVSLASCPNYFDGSDVTYTVAEGGTVLTDGGVAVTPVPYARFADQAGVNNDCPIGYQLTIDVTFSGDMRLCQRRRADGVVYDEVVRVGTGATTFWIDRYEAAVFDAMDTQYGVSDNTYPGLGFNGQWSGTRNSLKAVSRGGFFPSSSISWFQAAATCRASGKRLPTRDEWFAAADGLTATDVSINNCNVNGMPAGPRRTGIGSRCQSSWGAHDMIGNVWEWTDEWYANAGAITSPTLSVPSLLRPDGGTFAGGTALAPTALGSRLDGGVRVNDELDSWPGVPGPALSGYGDDRTWNVTSVVSRGPGGDNTVGQPAAAVRGGAWDHGNYAGVFALSLTDGPSSRYDRIGFRCVIPR